MHTAPDGLRCRCFSGCIGICGGIEFALDRSTISHYLLYLLMFAALAVPVTLGILLLRNRKKGTEAL